MYFCTKKKGEEEALKRILITIFEFYGPLPFLSLPPLDLLVFPDRSVLFPPAFCRFRLFLPFIFSPLFSGNEPHAKMEEGEKGNISFSSFYYSASKMKP